MQTDMPIHHNSTDHEWPLNNSFGVQTVSGQSHAVLWQNNSQVRIFKLEKSITRRIALENTRFQEKISRCHNDSRFIKPCWESYHILIFDILCKNNIKTTYILQIEMVTNYAKHTSQKTTDCVLSIKYWQESHFLFHE